MIFIIILIYSTVFIAWIIFEKSNTKQIIRIPVILLLTFIVFIAGTSLGIYFCHLETCIFNQNMRIIENKLRSNDLYSVKESVLTYNQAIKTMNNYKALKYMNHKLLNIDSEPPKLFYEEDILMKTNNDNKNIRK